MNKITLNELLLDDTGKAVAETCVATNDENDGVERFYHFDKDTVVIGLQNEILGEFKAGDVCRCFGSVTETKFEKFDINDILHNYTIKSVISPKMQDIATKITNFKIDEKNIVEFSNLIDEYKDTKKYANFFLAEMPFKATGKIITNEYVIDRRIGIKIENFEKETDKNYEQALSIARYEEVTKILEKTSHTDDDDCDDSSFEIGPLGESNTDE